MGYVETAVNVSEGDGMARLTVAITVPPGADQIETSFNLLVNTLNGTAIAADLSGLPLLNLYVSIKYSDNNVIINHTQWVPSMYHISLSVVIKCSAKGNLCRFVPTPLISML